MSTKNNQKYTLTPKELKKQIKKYKRSRLLFQREKQSALREQAFKTITDFSDGNIKVNPNDFPTMEKYIITFCKNGRHTVNRIGYNGFMQLNHLSRGHRHKKPGLIDSVKNFFKPRETHGISNIIQDTLTSKQPGKIKKAFNKATKWIKAQRLPLLAVTVAVGGIFSLRQCRQSDKTVSPASQAQTVNTPTAAADTATINFNDVKKQVTLPQTLHRAWKNYYDSALRIHLGENGRDNLYRQLQKQIADGKLSLPNNVSIEQCAHVLTISNLVQPNSSDNKTLQKALEDQQLTASEQAEFNSIIRQAGQKAEHIKGTSSHSNFDKQSKKVQVHHIKCLKDLKQIMAHSR